MTNEELDRRKEEFDRRKEEFDRRYDEIDPIYTSIEQVPERYRAEALELIALGEIPTENNKMKVRESKLQGLIFAKRFCSVAIKWDGNKKTKG